VCVRVNFQTGYRHPVGRPVRSSVTAGPYRLFHAERGGAEAVEQFGGRS